jgi:hypothetical protein
MTDGLTEYARVIDCSPQWDSGAPMPQVFSNGHKTFLIYLINEPDADLNGTNLTMIENPSDVMYPLALVEFDGGTSRFGIANDEVFVGLPLAKKGLQRYRAHIIENFRWVKEIKTIHNVHPYYHEDRWIAKKHYILLFKDELFEVIATNYKIEIFRTTFETIGTEVVKRMNK